MANAKSLEGKEYIDYLLNYLKDGNEVSENAPLKANEKRKAICKREICTEDVKRLSKLVEDDNMLYYLSISGGYKVLIDSLYLNSKSGVLSMLRDLMAN